MAARYRKGRVVVVALLTMLDRSDIHSPVFNSTDFFTARGGETLVQERPFRGNREARLHGVGRLGRSVRHHRTAHPIRKEALRAVSLQARASKRCFDVAAALVLGLLALPLIVAIALWIRLDSPGGAFFSQIRPGRYGKRFRIYKFRTMHVDAEQRFARLSPEMRAEFDLYGKIKDDPRITRAGYWLRRLSLDELPQLWNVLSGDMNMVGPRAYLVDQLSQITNPDIVFQVKPGLTGLWQVNGRSSIPFDRRLKLDAYYIRRWSIALDVSIIFRTFSVVLKGTGAY
jgi:lipopolysaccharide/colanic/teichoic acid biosynthesis glycosyltransferase